MKYTFYTRYCPHSYNAPKDVHICDLLEMYCCTPCGESHFLFRLTDRTLITTKCDFYNQEETNRIPIPDLLQFLNTP